MQDIKLIIDNCTSFVSKETIMGFENQVKACSQTLENGTGEPTCRAGRKTRR